ncbi:uncharacterized protein LOC119729246 [Patiria miniata]|uniref:Sushi domain-containing protein n=1 Tax=Patiria miniata TaxID=46514 RepID=A0A914A1Q7_PATMI|nr:uncharacterized protein LOC119729246 [Patiria miniata]
MPTARTGAGRAFAPWNPAGFVTLLWFHLGLLLQESVLVIAQSQCSSGMCERPPSTLSTQSTSPDTCYDSGRAVLLLCNPGFRLSGDNYTAKCSDGVWTPDSGCRIDLFTVFVAASASMVAILIFFLCFLCFYNWRCTPRKRKQHNVSKVKKEKKKRARAKADPEAANGRRGEPNGHVEDPDQFEDDFTDDEEEGVVPNRDTRYDDNIYQNQGF